MQDLTGFRTLPEHERGRVSELVREVALAAGTRAFGEGEPSESVWAVKDGVVHIVKAAARGRETVLEVIPPGEFFGAVAAFENRPYPASAVAAEPSVVWRLPAGFARELCERYPALRIAVLAQVTGRLRAAHERLHSVALEPAEQRLARVLLALAGKIGRQKGDCTVVSVTRQELGDMAGTTVETAIRVTGKWQRVGIVRSSRHELGLLDPGALRAIAEGTPPARP